MSNSPLKSYLASTPADKINTAFVSYIANLEQVAAVGPEVAASVVNELEVMAATEKFKFNRGDYAS